MQTAQGRSWKNWAGNQASTPELSFWPETVHDIVDIIRIAEGSGKHVRAVGSGHSWSDVAKTDEYLVYPERLTRILDIDSYLLRANLPVPKRMLIHVESGITIRALNAALDERGLAFINLGGYDGQTICGVTSTSTHGSGITFLPLCDFIKSMEIVSCGGKIWRIEPSPASGFALTDSDAYAAAFPDRNTHELVQDDDWFYAAMVGMGCMGVIYSVALEVREAFLLKETRTPSTWADVKRRLANGAIYDQDGHYELLLNPYAVDGANRCLVNTRNETMTPGNRERSIFVKYKAALDVSAWWVRLLSLVWPSRIRQTLNGAIDALRDEDYTDKSFKVFHIGDANEIRVISAEYAIPVENDTWIAAIDRLIDVAERVAREKRLYLTVPVAVRFVKGTRALLSPMHGRDTCMLEVMGLRDVKGTVDILQRIEQALHAHAVRPHWGQVNHITPEQLPHMYHDSYVRWKAVHDQLNIYRTFSSPFTRRVGII